MHLGRHKDWVSVSKTRMNRGFRKKMAYTNLDPDKFDNDLAMQR